MQFEWDEAKNRANFRKHRIWLEEAQTVWADSKSVEFFDPSHSSSEDRFLRIGHSTAGRWALGAGRVLRTKIWKHGALDLRPEGNLKGRKIL
jgi:uncharacterized DUF497 family protein